MKNVISSLKSVGHKTFYENDFHISYNILFFMLTSDLYGPKHKNVNIFLRDFDYLNPFLMCINR